MSRDLVALDDPAPTPRRGACQRCGATIYASADYCRACDPDHDVREVDFVADDYRREGERGEHR